MSGGLRELQRAVKAYVLAGEEPALGHVSAPPGADPRERLGIYAEAYRLRLIEALATDYPAVHTLVGDEVFDRLARAYIDAHPPEHFSVRWYGRRLPAFLQSTGPYRDQPVLAEMAAFEWHLGEALDAADAAPLERAALTAVPPAKWETLRLAFHPSLRRLDLEWNAPALWSAIQEEQPPRPPERAPAPVPWLLWRQGIRAYFRSLDAPEAEALDAARDGEPFGALCERLAETRSPEDAARQAAAALERWVGEGLVVGVDPA